MPEQVKAQDLPLLEISTALVDMADEMRQNRAALDESISKAAQGVANEVSAPMAELVEALTKLGPDMARMLTQLVATMAEQRAQPAQEIVIQAPSQPDFVGWDFDIRTAPNGAITGLSARKIHQ